MENYHSRSGITISLPPFDASTDQLYQSIKSLVNHKFISFSRRMDRLENRQDEVMQTLNRIQETLVQVLEQNTNFYQQQSSSSINDRHQDTIESPEYNHIHSNRTDDSVSGGSANVNYIIETAQRDQLQNDLILPTMNYQKSNQLDTAAAFVTSNDAPIFKTEPLVIQPPPNASSIIESPCHNNTYRPTTTATKKTKSRKRPNVSKLSLLSPNSRLEPRIVFDPECRKQILVGGQPKFRMPLWIYMRCLELVRSNTVECGPRLCLLLLQAMYGRNYMLTHNYNGTFGKQPIAKATLNAILSQAKMQFDDDYFITNSVAYSKFRDYINNAFRVVAFQMRRGKRSALPFWDSDGEPIKSLDPPSTYRINLGNLSEENSSSSRKAQKLDAAALMPANQHHHLHHRPDEKGQPPATMNTDGANSIIGPHSNLKEQGYCDNDTIATTVIYVEDDKYD